MDHKAFLDEPYLPHEVSHVPLSLRHWVKDLSWLSLDLLTSVASMANQLEAMLAAYWVQQPLIGEDADGYDGITRKGSPELLLLSEWALADEIPDEFIRRTLMNEQLYLQPHLTSTASNKTIYLLLDGSIEQWGSPRLLHLVALIIFNRYAQSRSSQFCWSFLHNIHGQWNIGFNRHNVKIWQHGKNTNIVTTSMIEAWQSRLEKETDQPYEVWIIGGESVKASCTISDLVRVITCSEPLMSDYPQHLAVAIVTGMQQSSSPTFYLSLPNAAIQTQLLRKPFRENILPKEAFQQTTVTQKHQRPFMHAQLKWMVGTRRALMRYPMDKLQIISSIREMQSTISLPDEYHQSTCIGCTVTSKQNYVCLLLNDDNTLTILVNNDVFRNLKNEQKSIIIDEDILWVEVFYSNNVVYVLDNYRNLWRIDHNSMQLIQSNVYYCRMMNVKDNYELQYLHKEHSTLKWQKYGCDAERSHSFKPFTHFHDASKDFIGAALNVFIGYAANSILPTVMIAEFRMQKLTIFTQKDRIELSLPKNYHCVGLLNLSAKHYVNKPSVLVMNHEHTELSLYHNNEASLIKEFPSRVVNYDYNFVREELIVLLGTGDVALLNVNTGLWTEISRDNNNELE